MSSADQTRRLALAAAGLALVSAPAFAADADKDKDKKPKGPGQEKETPAVEDLMREHGVLRRALLVYRQVALRLAPGGPRFDARLLNQTARLFRAFGEDYHERKLEEAHIFPVIRRTRGPAASYPDVLTAQHNRGREITEYVLAITRDGTLNRSDAEALARVLDRFVLMYENHAAREDTVVFPAWKLALSDRQIDELGDQFEDIEKQQFGHDGFEDAVRQISDIERAYGFSDIGQFTAPPPPKR
jgi:hemerythrin-like domain-containing protein